MGGAAFDPELDDSRDGLPLLLKQTKVTSTAMEGVREEDDDDGGVAVMETSRDRGVKRKEAPAPAPTPKNSPQKEESGVKVGQLPPTAWTKGTPALTKLFGLEVNAKGSQVREEGVEEGAMKKQKLTQSAAVSTQTRQARLPTTATFITPVSVKRVTRSAWKRINDDVTLPSAPRPSAKPSPTTASAPPPSPSLPAINAGPTAKKKRVVVTTKEKALASQPSPSPSTTPATSAVDPTASTSVAEPSSPSPSASSTTPPPPPSPRTLARRLSQRRKQIDLGKRTTGYLRYIAAVPRRERQDGHPRTPQPGKSCSKRSWDGQVRKWRRELHKWDPEGQGKGEEEGEGSELGSEMTMELASELSGKGEEGESELSSEAGAKGEEAEAEEESELKEKAEMEVNDTEVTVSAV